MRRRCAEIVESARSMQCLIIYTRARGEIDLARLMKSRSGRGEVKLKSVLVCVRAGVFGYASVVRASGSFFFMGFRLISLCV